MPRSSRLSGALVTILALITTLLAGCGLPFPFPQPTPNPILPDSQQIFRPQEIGPASGDLETLDPARIEFQTDYDIAQLLFPGLVTLDEQNKVVDWAAQSHEVSADGLTYTFHLRSGIMWSDGTPIQAQTFAYAINRALDPCTQAPNANYLYAIKGAQAFNQGSCPTGVFKSATSLIGSSLLTPDPLKLQIILRQPAGYFLAALTYPTSWAVPQAIVERYSQPVTRVDGSVHYPVDGWVDRLTDNGAFGGNLYRLTRWDHVGHLDLERNERFWGKKPVVRRIEYTLYKSIDDAWKDYQAGVGDVSNLGVNTLQSAPTLKGTVVQQTPVLNLSYLVLNWRKAPLDDVRVRQALSLAIDRQALARDAFQDTVLPTIHFALDAGARYNPDLADAAGRHGADALTADLDAARALMNAYASGQCHGDAGKCPPIALNVYPRSPSQMRAYVMILAQWQMAFPGWPITLALPIGAQHQQEKYDAFHPSQWQADYPDPQNYLSLLWTTQSAFHDETNVSIPQVDALCAQADAAQDQVTRLRLYQQAEQLLINQGAAIPLYQSQMFTAVRSHVVGWHVGPIGVTPLSVWGQIYIRR